MRSNNSTTLFQTSQYPLNLTALSDAHSKTTSIADLRMKAKNHMLKISKNFIESESLGLIMNVKENLI